MGRPQLHKRSAEARMTRQRLPVELPGIRGRVRSRRTQAQEEKPADQKTSNLHLRRTPLRPEKRTPQLTSQVLAQPSARQQTSW